MLLFLASVFSACEKYAEDTPSAIKKLIKKYNKSEEHIDFVKECKCGEKTIYYFRETKLHGHCYYFYMHMYDKEGNILCSAGTRRLQDNICMMEYGDCEEIRIIWERSY